MESIFGRYWWSHFVDTGNFSRDNINIHRELFDEVTFKYLSIDLDIEPGLEKEKVHMGGSKMFKNFKVTTLAY